MQKRAVFILIGLIVVWIGLNNLGSSLSLSDIAARPILAVTKGGHRVPVHQFGQATTAEAARDVGGEGVLFGYRFRYLLPSGETVPCTIRFRSLTCADGWTAERPD